MTDVPVTHSQGLEVADASRTDLTSLSGVAVLALRNRVTVMKIAVAVAVLLAGAALARPRTYSASVTFSPLGGGRGAARLAGVAAQFGLAIPAGDEALSPEFYAQLLASRLVLGSVADARIRYRLSSPRDTVSAYLVDVWELHRATLQRSREEVIRALRRSISVSVSKETGIVTARVRSPYPGLAEAIARRLLILVEEFNTRNRQLRGGAERRFAEARLREARSELAESEALLLRFLQGNREFANSPALRFEQDRLQRDVALRQQVVVGLAQSFEQARIEEVRNTPLVTVIDRPEFPARPEARFALFRALLGGSIGLALGVALVVGREGWRRWSTETPSGREINGCLRELWRWPRRRPE